MHLVQLLCKCLGKLFMGLSVLKRPYDNLQDCSLLNIFAITTHRHLHCQITISSILLLQKV